MKDKPVHPRACGERAVTSVCFEFVDGASPRMRGTVTLDEAGAEGVRCIPAHAGNGSSLPRSVCRLPVHPRACGERSTCARGGLARIGASPRMRGTGRLGMPVRAASRCIPAHAGNGFTSASGCTGSTVHPRACGERDAQRHLHGFVNGASPRMRGTARLRSGRWSGRRCIPAHAGNGP